jgi:hypothetical protein
MKIVLLAEEVRSPYFSAHVLLHACGIRTHKRMRRLMRPYMLMLVTCAHMHSQPTCTHSHAQPLTCTHIHSHALTSTHTHVLTCLNASTSTATTLIQSLQLR